MSCIALRRGLFLAALMVRVMALAATTVPAKEPTNPPHATSYGKTLAGWLRTWMEHSVAGTLNILVGPVKLLELPGGTDVTCSGTFTSADPALCVGSLDITLGPGTPFVLPVSLWF